MLSFILLFVFLLFIVTVPVILHSHKGKLRELEKTIRSNASIEGDRSVLHAERHIRLLHRVDRLEKALEPDTVTIHVGEPGQFGVDWAIDKDGATFATYRYRKL